MTARLLIFDLDGTLVDTSDQVNEITAELLQGAGVSIQAADVAASRALNSLGARPKLEGLAKLYGVTITDDRLTEMAVLHEQRKKELYDKGSFTVFEGLEACLKQLQSQFVLAIGSNAPSSASEQALETAGLLHFFAGRIYGPDNTGGISKPAPDVFLKAAEKCGFDSSHAIVIGDSLTDLEAAISAKMPCYIILAQSAHSAVREEYLAKGCAGFFTAYQEFPDLRDKQTDRRLNL